MNETQSNLNVTGGAPYQYQTNVALVFDTSEPETVPFHRFYSAKKDDHFYSMSNNTPPDYAYEQVACYVYPSPICGSVPLYELYAVAASDTAYTVNETERNGWKTFGGYVDKPIAAYVLKPSR